MILSISLAVGLNTLRKDGFLPYPLPRSFAGESERGEQAVIYQQPARACIVRLSSPITADETK